MKALGKFVLGVLFFVGNTWLSGYVVSRFWSWFILSIFQSLPRLDVLHGVGLMMFVKLFGVYFVIAEIKANTKKEEISVFVTASANAIGYLILLLLGYVLHCLM